MSAHAKAIGNRRRTFPLRAALGLAALGACGAAAPAHAVVCGETVGPGGRVVLGGNLLCGQSTAPEESAALVVVGPVVVDLGRSTVSCAEDGALRGTGIDVKGFGARVRNGTIENCDKGVVVEGDGRHRLARLTVTSPNVAGDGGIAFQVKSALNLFAHNAVRKYAGEGFRLGDDGVSADVNVLKFNRVNRSGNHAFRVRLGQRNLLFHNHANRDAGEGFRSQDENNRFIGNTAKLNGDDGVRIRDDVAQNNLIIFNRLEANGLVPCDPSPDGDANAGIAITNDAANNKIIANDVNGNCLGIAVEEASLSNRIIGNDVADSQFVDMADGNEDCDENQWRGNEFETSRAGPALEEEDPACIR